MIAFTRKVSVCVGFAACTLMFFGCRTPGAQIARQEQTRDPKQDKNGIAERRAFVDEPNVPSEDENEIGLSLSTAPEEAIGTAGDQIDRAAQGRKTVECDAQEGAKPKRGRPEPQDSTSEDRKDETAGAPNRRSGENKSPDPTDAEPEPGRPSDEVGGSTIGSDAHEAPLIDNGGDGQQMHRVEAAKASNDGSPSESTSGNVAAPQAAHEFGETSGNEADAASTLEENRDDADPKQPASGSPVQGATHTAQEGTVHGGAPRAEDVVPSAPALVPVIPAQVEETTPTVSGEIVYPEAPPPIEVTSEQVDALRLPATDPKRPIIGIWEQVGGEHSADFAEGNYARTVLVFRTDGVLEVVRWFGAAREIRLDSMLNYTVPTGDQMRLELPQGTRGTNRSAYSIPLGGGTSVRIEPRTMHFPATLGYTQQDTRLVLNGKTYHRSESP